MKSGGIAKVKLVLALILLVTAGLVMPSPLRAASCTTGTLDQQKACLQQQNAQLSQNITQGKQTINSLQDAIAAINDNIGSLDSQIANTESQIRLTNNIITNLSGQIDSTQKQLADLTLKLNNAYVNLYELSQTSTIQMVLQGQPLNDLLNQAQYIQSIQTGLQKNIDTANALQNDLQSKKKASEDQKASLQQLDASLNSQQNNLSAQQAQKSYLLGATSDQVSSYLSNYTANQQKIAKIQQQIDALTYTNNWGTDIVSGSQTSWYYSQEDPQYKNVLLGNGPWPNTVGNYGCLITSFAMLATYYGHSVTPADIAHNTGIFNDGYLTVTTPPGIGITTNYTAAFDKNVVNNELDSGHPVIASIYLPSVGAINADGSSHFIVIYAHNGNKYLMQDPIAPGRSYSLSQVRSMKIIRPL